MSVLIKGLNLKPCKDGVDGKGLVIIGYDDELYAVAHEQIIPLPDHGDLIDRDAFIKVNREYLCKDCERRKGVKNGRKRTLYEIGGVPCRACGVEDMFEYLDDAPVLIPAERSEE